MSSILDSPEFLSFYLGLNIVLIILNIIFLILRRKESSANKLKFLIILLLGTAILIFALNSLPFYTDTSESTDSSREVVFNNVFLILLSISIEFFFYSIYHFEEDIVELKKPSFFKSRKGKVKIGKIVENGQSKRKFFLSLEEINASFSSCKLILLLEIPNQ